MAQETLSPHTRDIAQPPQASIFWDFHGTIIDMHTPQAGEMHAWALRPGIIETLSRLQAAGFSHAITTGGETPYVLQQMDHADPTQTLRRSIDTRNIFPKSVVDAGVGKRYRQVAQQLGFHNERQAAAGLVAVGDVITDQPVDIDGMVFIFEPSGAKHTADTVTRVIKELSDRGKEDFSRGFHALHTAPGKDYDIGHHALQITADGEEFGVFTQIRRPFQDRERFGVRAEDVSVLTVRIQPLRSLTELAYYQNPTTQSTHRGFGLSKAFRRLFSL